MNKPILACITAQEHCAKIIGAAKIMAERLNTELIVATVLPIKATAQERAQNFKCLKQLSLDCGVDIVVRYSDTPAESLAKQAKECSPLHIFMGENNGFINRFVSLYSVTPISVVSRTMVFTLPPEHLITA